LRLGMGGRSSSHRIQDPGLRRTFLPRRPACLHLPTTKCSDCLPQKNAVGGQLDDHHSNSNHSHSNHNEKWETSSNMSDDSQSHSLHQPQQQEQHHLHHQQLPVKKKKKMKFLEELQNEPMKTKEDIAESQQWKTLDDLVDMAYKIRVNYEFDWEVLLEEDAEYEEQEAELLEHEEQQKQKKQPLPPKQKQRLEKPNIHLQRCMNDGIVSNNPSVLLTS